MQERLAIAGSGTIACGLAAVAAEHGEVLLWARSDDSAARAQRSVARHCAKLEHLNGCASRVRISTEIEMLADATFLVEAVVEDAGPKGAVLAELASVTGPDEIVATTTSSPCHQAVQAMRCARPAGSAVASQPDWALSSRWRVSVARSAGVRGSVMFPVSP